jgi:hypothetical protein
MAPIEQQWTRRPPPPEVREVRVDDDAAQAARAAYRALGSLQQEGLRTMDRAAIIEGLNQQIRTELRWASGEFGYDISDSDIEDML